MAPAMYPHRREMLGEMLHMTFLFSLFSRFRCTLLYRCHLSIANSVRAEAVKTASPCSNAVTRNSRGSAIACTRTYRTAATPHCQCHTLVTLQCGCAGASTGGWRSHECLIDFALYYLHSGRDPRPTRALHSRPVVAPNARGALGASDLAFYLFEGGRRVAL